jgi:hypothetical protein
VRLIGSRSPFSTETPPSAGTGSIGSPIKSVDWLAYPEYSDDIKDFPPLSIGKGLAYTCAIEKAASSVEVSWTPSRRFSLNFGDKWHRECPFFPILFSEFDLHRHTPQMALIGAKNAANLVSQHFVDTGKAAVLA